MSATAGTRCSVARAAIVAGVVSSLAVPVGWAAPLPRPKITSEPGGILADPNPQVTWRGTPGAVYTWTVTRAGQVVVGPRRTRASSVRLPDLADGTYTFGIVQSLAGQGRSSEALTRPFRIDRVAPDPPRFTASPGVTAGAAAPQASWEGEGGGSYSVELRDGTGRQVLSLETGERSMMFPRLESGTFVLSVAQIDDAGNAGRPATARFTVDGAASPSTLSVGQVPPFVNRPPEPRVSAPPGVGLAWVLSGPVSRSGSGSQIAIPDIPDGRYRLSVEATSGAVRAAAVEFVLDRVAPAPPAVKVAVGLPGSGAARLTWSGEVDGSLSWELLADGRRLRGPEVVGEGPVELTGLPAGAYAVRASQLDAAGNSGASVNVAFRLQDRPPEVRVAAPAPTPSIAPRGVTRPVPGAVVERTRPLLRWRVPAKGERPYAYNVQVFRDRVKVHSGFSRTSLYRLPPDILTGGGRYFWQVWAYDATRRSYRDAPIALGYFDTVRDLLTG